MFNRSTVLPPLCLAVIFVVGLSVGFLLWPHLSLPYNNPWGIVGLPALRHYHPANNILRFAVLILCPTLILAALYALGGVRMRTLLAQAPAAAARKGLSRAPAAAVVLVAVLAALNIPTYHAWGELNRFHEGESLGASVSHLNGEIPYRDYLFVHGVYQDPLRSALAFDLFGRSIASARMLESIVKLLAFALLAWALIELFRPSSTAALAALLFIVALHGLVQLEAMWLPLAPLRIMQRDVVAMAFLIALARLYRAAPGFAASAFALSFVSLGSFGYSIDRGFYLTGTAVVAAAGLYFFFLRGTALARRFWTFLAAGAVAAVVLVGFLLQWEFGPFWTFTFQIMPRYKEWMDGLIYPIRQAPMWGICALIAFNAFVLTLHLLRSDVRRFVSTYFLESCLLVMSVFFFRSALGRSDIVHVSVNSWPAYLLVVMLLWRYWPPRWDGLLRKVVLLGAVVLSAACLYRLKSSNSLRENFPAGRLDSSYLPESYLSATRFLRENLRPDESFFTLTSEAIWYYLVDRPCPARFSVVWFAAPSFYQQEIIDALEGRQVRLVLYRNQAPSNQIDGIGNEERLPLLWRYIGERYAPFRNVDGHEIWARK